MRVTDPVSLFLFAHQDDEFGVYQGISEELARNRRVLCCYLTDGGFNGVSTSRRNAESTAVLTALGVSRGDIFFGGAEQAIPDNKLLEHLHTADQYIDAWLGNFSSVESIYVPAWEGGHPDHDALHAVAAWVANRRGLLSKVAQFSLYNAFNRPAPFFRVMRPLEANGPICASRISWKARCRYLRFCASYPSQAKTWLGLSPFVLGHYIFNGHQALQPVSLARLNQRPHVGALYYERRQFCTWETMRSHLQAYFTATE